MALFLKRTINRGDTIVSARGNTTALYSIIERLSNYQWTVKMSRNTERCLHRALNTIVKSGAGILTLTHDNGMESRNVKTIPLRRRYVRLRFLRRCIRQQPKSEKRENHTFHRRFLGHGKLSKFSQSAIQEITNFINNYPRRKFYGKSASEVRNMLLKGESPQIRPPQLKKWQRALLKKSRN